MAVDEVLLKSSIPVLRFYTWEPGFLSIGCYQETRKSLNHAYLSRKSIKVVRRPTGGRGVLHENDLSYAVMLPGAGLNAVYKNRIRMLTGSIARGLNGLGCPAQLGDEASVTGGTAFCFTERGSYEITVHGKKIAGCAHLFRNGHMLEQGSILLDYNPEAVLPCFTIHEAGSRITSLKEETGAVPEWQRIMETMVEGFREISGFLPETSSLTDDECTQARRLAEEKYSRDDWNFSL